MLYGKLREYRLVITFPSVSEALKSERRLESEGCDFVTIPTPRSLTAGCGLSLCIAVEKIEKIYKLLNDGIKIDGVYEAEESGYSKIELTKNDVN